MATTRKVSVPAILLLLAVLSCLFLVQAAVAAGNRRALLPREATDDVDVFRGQQALPTTAEEAAVGGEPQLADEEIETAARRVDLQTQDYRESGANSRHDPRNPH
ncbi:uncharacterized protein LOC133909856 [Phragmites australis]|uniref:uncharacterized protein LOC133909856 n=1 Tax=Phragmites australis TaxID=29695 RepID=UPI002D77AC65|nr:uncharacterized protein LOC133909856 [Phragmites australis]